MELREMKKEELPRFVFDVQEAFQKGYEDYFGKCEDTIIPEKDIMVSYQAQGSKTYVMTENGQIVGGAIVVVDPKNGVGDLHILYVKAGCQSKGVGFAMWQQIEKRHPEIKVWKTCTPYFDQRNIHFYVNKCKFHIVEFMNLHHHPNDYPDPFIGDHGEGMFEFEKVMQ